MIFILLFIVIYKADVSINMIEGEKAYIELDAKEAPSLENVKSWYWQCKDSTVQLENEDRPIVRIKTDSLKVGQYHVTLSRCNFIVVEHTNYTINVIPKMRANSWQGEPKSLHTIIQTVVITSNRGLLIEMESFLVVPFLFTRYVVNVLHGFIIYWQYHSDCYTPSTYFFSKEYKEKWHIYRVNTTHYNAITTVQELEKYRDFYCSSNNSNAIDILSKVDDYFEWNENNPHRWLITHCLNIVFQVQVIIVYWAVMIMDIISFGTIWRYRVN